MVTLRTWVVANSPHVYLWRPGLGTPSAELKLLLYPPPPYGFLTELLKIKSDLFTVFLV